jgi:hypothetical protein
MTEESKILIEWLKTEILDDEGANARDPTANGTDTASHSILPPSGKRPVSARSWLSPPQMTAFL